MEKWKIRLHHRFLQVLLIFLLPHLTPFPNFQEVTTEIPTLQYFTIHPSLYYWESKKKKLNPKDCEIINDLIHRRNNSSLWSIWTDTHRECRKTISHFPPPEAISSVENLPMWILWYFAKIKWMIFLSHLPSTADSSWNLRHFNISKSRSFFLQENFEKENIRKIKNVL